MQLKHLSCFRHLFISQGQEAEARKELLKLRATVEEVDREIKEMAAEKMVSSVGTVRLVILCLFYFNIEQCCGLWLVRIQVGSVPVSIQQLCESGSVFRIRTWIRIHTGKNMINWRQKV